MRVKISFEDPNTKTKENIVLAIPNNLKKIADLESFLIEKFGLSIFLEKNKKMVCLKIDGFSLPKNEQINSVIHEDEVIK
jgi:hypothetical protein